ncbi:MAG: molybdopterin-synthase adenylyltransferase MoeB [Chloroflexi bacterium]|nr:molybdopterin-synthase adenylyltransferase MoeB [Chloroflexota bacterium]
MLQDFSSEEIQRYSRHLMIPEIGLEGQRKLKNSSVLMVGAGGLGSPIGLYLAAAGVGHIGIVDYDRVEISNLQRQVMHGTSTVGEFKAESARQRMLDINPTIHIDTFPVPFTSENALDIAAGYQILVDGTDNFPTRYLVNDLCVLTGRPFVYGAVYRFEGQASVFDSRVGPCYRCILPQPPPPGVAPGCSEIGVFGVMPGLVGLIQATEVIKLILGIGETLTGKLMLLDALTSSFQTIQIKKNPACNICGDDPQITHLVDYTEFCGVPFPGGHAVSENLSEITPCELVSRLANGDHIRLIDVRQSVEQQISNLPGAELIPFETLAGELGRFSPEDQIVLFCRTGNRSLRAQQLLHEAGFQHVWNLRGGINAWAREVDPTMAQY